jgi:cell division septum initiation protein DivIVA
MTKRPERPEFAASIRGYDRLQVDDYIDRLIEILADAEERAHTAEAELEFSRHTTVGARVGEIFELAVEEAKELRERVSNETEEMRGRARKDADAMTARGKRAAAETLAEAERLAQETIARAEETRDQVLGEVEALSEKKAALLGDFERLQRVLATAIRTAAAKPAKEGKPGEGPKTEAQEDESAAKRGSAPEKRRATAGKPGAPGEKRGAAPQRAGRVAR